MSKKDKAPKPPKITKSLETLVSEAGVLDMEMKAIATQLDEKKLEIRKYYKDAPDGKYRVGTFEVSISRRTVTNFAKAVELFGNRVCEMKATAAAVKAAGLTEKEMAKILEPGTTAVSISPVFKN